ncbi:catechol 2,3-dioxygenase [Acidocella sp.]|uniref:catechol 2,3-dioxygenase n=1 Tax=Acidocella sp. TaxID=50710 RepID=UPI003D021E2E
MAITGVLRPGHTQLRVLDLEASVKFYTDIMGLEETGRDSSGRVYFKCLDEVDHHSLIIRQSEKTGMDFYGFRVLDRQTLEKLDSDLRAFGIPTTHIPAGDLLETGERIRFTVPSGHVIELYAEKTNIGNSRGYLNPEVVIEGRRGISPVRLDHWQVHGGDIDGSVKVFTKILGFSVTEQILLGDGTAAAVWLSCSNKAHDIAFVRDERDNTLHHTAFYLDSWHDVLNAADIMGKYRVKVDIGPTRHGITRGATIYAFDPSGNRFETFAGGYTFYPDIPPITWTEDEMGAAIFYHDRKLNEAFLTVVT